MGAKKANFFQKILWKLHIKKPNYNITAEDRALALTLRQKRASLNIKRLDVEEILLNKEIEASKLQSPEEKLAQVVNIVLDNFISSGIGKLQKNTNSPHPRNSKEELTLKPAQNQHASPLYEDVQEAEIKETLKQIDPKVLNWLKDKSDTELKEIAKSQLGLSGQNVDTGIKVLRTWDYSAN